MRPAPAGGSRPLTDSPSLEILRHHDDSHDPYDSASWNACEPDKSQEVRIICRSLTTLRLELSHNRVATVGGNIVHVTCCDSPQLHCLCAAIDWTTDKLRKEYERRQETNTRAVAVLMNNLNLWNHVDGPAPEDELRNPSEISLLAAKDSCRALACLAEAHGSSPWRRGARFPMD